jgi:hypothetical protein
MPPPLKDCDAAIDFAAFMLAMVIVRHVVNVENVNQQWSAEKLAENNNEMVYSDHPNFNIDSRALKQGMALFAAEMRRRGVEVITMYQEGTSEFFSLTGRSRSFEIKFSTYSTPPEYTESQLLHEFRSVRDMILKRCHYHPSIHSTPAAVYGCLYHGTILGLQNNENDINETSTSVAPGKRIKKMSPKDRNERSINRTVIELIKNVENQVGEENTLFYLQLAVKYTIKSGKINETSKSGNQESKKRKYDSEKRGDTETNEGNIIGAVNVADDVRILNSLKEIR